MNEMSKEDALALCKAAGIEIHEPELTEVQHNLNAILQTMDDIDIPSVNVLEPLPIIIPQDPLYG